MAAPPEIQPDWALFLDFDGTLVDIAARPERVTIPDGLPELLRVAAGRLDGALAVVSGRALPVIDSFLVPYADAAGAEHGAVVRKPDGSLDETATPAVPAGWLTILEAAVAANAGLVIERKPRSVVLHYRLAPEKRAEARALADALPGLDEYGFAVLAGHMAFEVKPRSVSKRRAVAVLMETPPFAGRRPVFVGDDVTDEDGIAMACALGGFGLRVADDFGGSPANVRAWLRRGAGT
ncbi:MAG: trehalose-phosphatase [Micropepsaceae bacterium]